MIRENKETLSAVILLESVEWIICLRYEMSVHLGETFRGEVLVVDLVLKPYEKRVIWQHRSDVGHSSV